MQRDPHGAFGHGGQPFHARVIAARLGVEGIATELRGNVDGLYPMGDVHVYVDEDDLAEAQELLLVDEVESAFDDPSDSRRPGDARGSCGSSSAPSW